ncbi:dihydrolipoyl dehydrogenase [Henriciella algicola]|uniref:Dihydrolipoyl dehydrogenase n=1 Tax=Henriciella algicola TaxID=1608422 RepID=A0A399RNU6_9PROT|nr:dihydrolipoyl dehydrogenase [Henriciella algicola]RIJ31492.1 dihydrolipoyl dehydrogenase [Henriciella algicola]
MSDTYDVVIIGGGPGGYNCAIRCGQLGLKTAIIDKRGVLGGTCLNVGCIPSKALLHGSELFAAAKNDFAGLGIKMSGLELDLDQMMSQKTDAVNGLTQGIEFLMKKNKVDYVKGFGRIKEKGVVEVDAEDGEQKTLTTKNIVIATGSVPSSLPNIEIDEERVVTNEGAIALKEVPEKLIVIGAGIIGLELGSVWSRLGASVTVVEYLDRIMPGADDEIAKEAQRTFKKQGLEFRLGQKVTGVERIDGHVKLFMEPAAGGDQETLEANAIIVAVGRRPYTEGLGLEAVGGKTDKRGVIETTDHFKVTDGVWAIGDCIHGPMLAHKAEDDGAAVAELIAGKAGHVDYDLVPSVVYTNPEIAWVGKTEAQLKEAGIEYKKGKFPFQANSRARTNHETTGFVKILADAKTDRILGAHMMGVGVGEMIHEICIAMEFGAASEDVARTCHAHPTMSEAVRQAAMGVEGWTMQM